MAARRQWRRPPWPFVLNTQSEQAQGLVAWLPLGAAGGWYDMSPYRRAFANVDTTLYDDPVMGRVRDLSGTNQYIRLASGLATAPPLTFGAWINPDTLASRVIVNVQNSASTGLFDAFSLVILVGGPIGARTGAAAATSVAQSTANYVAGEWEHAGGVFASATDRRAFVRGANKGTEATSRVPSGINQTNIGIAADLTNDFPGLVSHVTIWNRTLTDDEVYRLWHDRTRWELYYQIGRRKTFMPPHIVRRGAIIGGGVGSGMYIVGA